MIGRIVFVVVLVSWVISAVAIAQDGKKTEDLRFSSFQCTYDYSLGIPVYTSWDIDKSDIGDVRRNRSWRFKSDSRIKRPRPDTNDYTNSGFQRGHMCPAADRSSSIERMKETFIMTNVCPQSPRLNTGPWKVLELESRAMAKRLGRVHVRVAPLFFHQDTMRIGRHQIAVPHAFIKVVYRSDSITPIYCSIFSNE